MRLRLDLGYDGTDFSGWAAQPGRRTVEGVLSAALTTVMRAADPVRLTVAGRTDAGVHATGQVAHFDVDADAFTAVAGRGSLTPQQALRRRLDGILPDDVVVHEVSRAPEGFDARFAALDRRYEYRIADGLARKDPLRRRDTVWRHEPLDIGALQVAASPLLGLHDFAAFCKPRDGATTTRTLLEFAWRREADGVVVATVRADAFCHSMVRALVGAAVDVGRGRRPPAWPTAVLAACRRDSAVTVAPAHGLTLVEVRYPEPAGLAARASQARSRRDGTGGNAASAPTEIIAPEDVER